MVAELVSGGHAVEAFAQPSVRHLNQQRAHPNAAVGDHTRVRAHQQVLVEADQHFVGQQNVVPWPAPCRGSSQLPAQRQRRQYLEARPRITGLPERASEPGQGRQLLFVAPGANSGDQGEQPALMEPPDCCHGLPEGARSTNGVVHLLREAVEADANFERIAAAALDLRQAVRNAVGNQSAVGEHRGRRARERQAEHLQELRVQERLPARENHLLDAQAHRRFQFRPDAFERQKAERPDIRPAAVEAMRAGDIAKGPRNLEPQVVEVLKLDLGLRHVRSSRQRFV